MIRLSAPLLRNLLTGIPVTGVAAWFLYKEWHQPVILIASTFLILICLTDTLYTKIPNVLNLCLLIAGITYNLYQNGPQGIAWSALGMLAGLGLFIVPYLLGMGAGDVKALAALGSLLGPANIFEVFLYTALIGGALAVLHFLLTPQNWQKSLAALIKLRVFLYTRDMEALRPAPKGESQRFPYAVAIALGFFAFIHWGPIVKLLFNDKM